MSDHRVEGTDRAHLDAEKLKIQQQAAKQKALQAEIRQEISQEDATQWAEMQSFNPLEIGKKFQELEKRTPAETATADTEESEGEDKAFSVAQKFSTKNPELNARTLLIVREHLDPDDDPGTILGKVRSAYPDPSLADEAIDFLIEAGEDSAMAAKLAAAKEKFNSDHGVEIRAGRNIQTEARAFSEQGLGSPTALRDLYRGVIQDPKEPHSMFEELSNKFSYADMRKVIEFILHSLGSDMKAKGPSISRVELQNLFTEARVMQAIVGVYRFFEERMGLIKAEFSRADLTMPSKLSFENLAKIFMQFIQERYPNSAKVLSLARLLSIAEEITAQLIIFMQYRDALRNVSPRLFQSEKHRQNVLMALIEALSDLEEEEDEEEEEENRKPDWQLGKDTLE